jgi:hypothetical protein
LLENGLLQSEIPSKFNVQQVFMTMAFCGIT